MIGVDEIKPNRYSPTPPLTTMRQPAAEMGAAAAESLLKMIEGDSCQSRETEDRVASQGISGDIA